MTFIDDIIKSIKAELYERASSPLLTSFVISWLLWNYKFVLLIFSDEKILNTYKIIDEVLYTPLPIDIPYLGIVLIPEFITNITQTLILPSVTTWLYIFVYPNLAEPVFKFHKERQQKIINLKKEIEENTLLTADEARALRGEIYELRESVDAELNRKDSEIERLKIELKNVHTTNSSTAREEMDRLENEKEEKMMERFEKLDSSKNKKDNLSDNEIAVLQEIARDKRGASKDTIIHNVFSNNHIRAEYVLDEMMKKDYVYQDVSSPWNYFLKHRGKGYLINNDLV